MSSAVLTNSNSIVEKTPVKSRESNIELLRILTICGVVVLHYNGTQALPLVNENSVNYYIMLVLEALFICAVNLFVLISGYFLSFSKKRRTIKAIELLVQVIAMNLGIYFVSVVAAGGGFSLKQAFSAMIPNNYFVTLYITVYLISPYINLLLNHLSNKQMGIFVGLCSLIFSVWPTLLDSISSAIGVAYGGLYTTNSNGSQYGYSFINFALMYLIGAYLRRIDFNCKLKLKLGVLTFCLIALTVWQPFQPQVARAYCNPLVIICAISVFLIFKSIKFSSKMVNGLAKGAFTCFLLHGLFLPHIGISKVVNQTPVILILHILITVPLIFLICFVCWKIYDLITAPIFKIIGKKTECIDKLISIEE